jgi:hypothetical protein
MSSPTTLRFQVNPSESDAPNQIDIPCRDATEAKLLEQEFDRFRQSVDEEIAQNRSVFETEQQVLYWRKIEGWVVDAIARISAGEGLPSSGVE